MEHQINLYLDLEPGELADLEVVAKASLAFAGAVREIAYVLDPSLVVKLEIESGTSGSLSINSVMRFVRQAIPDPVTRKVILVSLTLWFAKETGAALIGMAVSDILTEEPAISEQDAQPRFVSSDRYFLSLASSPRSATIERAMSRLDNGPSASRSSA